MTSECLAKDKINVKDAVSVWAYTCNDNQQCQRNIEHPPFNKELMSLTECKLTCGPCSRLWPKPTGVCQNNGNVLHFNPRNVTINMENPNDGTLDYLEKTLEHYLSFLIPNNTDEENPPITGYNVKIWVEIGKNLVNK